VTMNEATLKNARILIVDDEQVNVLLLERLLRQDGYDNLTITSNSSHVVEICARTPPDLILLDLQMPHPDGFEVMRQLEPWLKARWLPILVLTADATPEARQRALSGGAKDFLVKPLDAGEVLLRIKNLLETRFLHHELRRQNLILEQRVQDQYEDLSDARVEILKRLAVAAEYRDDATGQHTQRVGRTAALVSRALDLDDEEVELIRYAAPLHDLGKIGVPDRILLKPGKLTPVERELMKNHVTVGAMILSGSRSPLLRVAEQVALTHHEWWNGTGYRSELRGKEIPLAGRIVAIADVFDALVHDRPYKKAVPVANALEEVRNLSERQFDPHVVEAFETLDHTALLAPVDGDDIVTDAEAINQLKANALALSLQEISKHPAGNGEVADGSVAASGSPSG
jgi:putative two-component system response regulator